MNHSFIPSQLDVTLCATCKRNKVAHGKFATCETCGFSRDCELYDDMLMCWPCKDKHIQGVLEAYQEKEPVRQTLANVRAIDATVQYNGDFFNSKIVAIEEMRRIVLDDASIKDEEKQFAFQNAVIERYKHLKDVIFELDEKKHDAVVEQLAIGKTLRELGSELRIEIREKLKEADSNYVPTARVVPKVKAVKKNPMERVIEALALAKGITYTEAKLMIEKGSI